ncbi:MAG TPA: dynamin, partial [Chloroflexota bacterium]|nr:dynamin [Chloroflexota bacterium]
LNDRADAFFDETLRLGRVFDLFNADRLRTEFERKVIADSARRIDDTVQSLVDWILDQEQRIWRSVADFVSRRTGAAGGTPSADALPTEGWSFAQERRRMLASVERAADHAMKQYDPDSEAKRWSLSMREAVTQTALTEVGALGLGAAVVALIGSTALDITGLLAASVVAGLGFYIIPLRRRQAREQFRQKTEALRTRLKDGLSRQFEAELERSAQRVGDVLAPYSRRVRAEYDRLERTGERLHSLQRQVADLRARAERELPSART